MNPPSTYLQLPLRFDVARMREDLCRIDAGEWISHFNSDAYENGWSCAPLRSVDGDATHIIPIDGGRFADTALMRRCAYLREVADSFACDKTSVRLMGLAPGAVIKEHRDPGTAMQDGTTRLHIPIQTSPEVIFHIDGEAVHFSAGHAWHMDASCRHAVDNRGASARIHLVLDCITNPWLEELFQRAGFQPRAPAPYGDPNIDDANVLAVIAALQASGTRAGAVLAGELGAVRLARSRTAR